MIERVLSQAPAAEMRFLRRSRNMQIRDKVRNCEIRKSLNLETFLLRMEISQITLIRAYVPNVPGKIGEASPAGYTNWKAAQSAFKDQTAWLHLRPCWPAFAWSQQNPEILADREIFQVLLELLPTFPQNGKRVWMNEWTLHKFTHPTWRSV